MHNAARTLNIIIIMISVIALWMFCSEISLDFDSYRLETIQRRIETIKVRRFNTTIYFIGNSHIRNLFRCCVDILSSGQAAKAQLSYSSSACNESAKPSENHCFTCDNISPVHEHDYKFVNNTSSIVMDFRWVVHWSVTDKNACNNNSSATNRTTSNCSIESLKNYRQHYSGNRLGYDILNSDLEQAFLDKDMKHVLIVNFYQSYNSLQSAIQLARKLSRPPFKGKAILVVDPTATRRFNSVIATFREHNVKIVDLRWIYRQHLKLTTAQPISWHLTPTLQKVLVRHIMDEVGLIKHVG